MQEIVFDVFARKSRGDPLGHVGYLSAPDADLARVYAWKTYDEENWFEMCIVPRSQIIPVNRTDGPFAASSAVAPASSRSSTARTGSKGSGGRRTGGKTG